MNTKETNVIEFPGIATAANDEHAVEPIRADDEADTQDSPLMRGVRHTLAFILMWLATPLSFLARVLNFFIVPALIILFLFGLAPAGAMWLLAGISFLLFMIPIGLDWLIDSVMPD